MVPFDRGVCDRSPGVAPTNAVCHACWGRDNDLQGRQYSLMPGGLHSGIIHWLGEWNGCME